MNIIELQTEFHKLTDGTNYEVKKPCRVCKWIKNIGERLPSFCPSQPLIDLIRGFIEQSLLPHCPLCGGLGQEPLTERDYLEWLNKTGWRIKEYYEAIIWAKLTIGSWGKEITIKVGGKNILVKDGEIDITVGHHQDWLLTALAWVSVQVAERMVKK